MNVLFALLLTWAIFEFGEILFNVGLPRWSVIVIYLACYGGLGWIRRPAGQKEFPNDRAPDRSAWPLPGPARHLGKVGFAAVFLITNSLCLLNPWQLWQMIRQWWGQCRLEQRLRKHGIEGSSYETRICYYLPFGGEWLVANGGVTPKTSHSWDILGQRYAMDFVRADPQFNRHIGSGTRVEDYHCYGQEILAAADGVVVAVVDGIRDAPLVGWGFCDFMARHVAGNHVMIRHAEGEYGFYAHLAKGSIRVSPGEPVQQAQVIGQCGHSGHSTEPHLHFHLQDSPDSFEGMGLPIRFADAEIGGAAAGDRFLSSGDRVRSSAGERADYSSERA